MGKGKTVFLKLSTSSAPGGAVQGHGGRGEHFFADFSKE